jgi:serine/threonine protein kinase
MKVIEKRDFQLEDPEERKRVRNQFIREVKIHMYLNHPNIAKLYGFFDD